jgi:hypothetical protein
MGFLGVFFQPSSPRVAARATTIHRVRMEPYANITNIIGLGERPPLAVG